MNLEEFYIPRSLDEPMRLLFLALDEACVLLAPFMIGVMISQTVIGLLAGVMSFIAWRRVKGGIALITYAAYWFLPSGFMRLRFTPPSSCRFFLG